MNEKIISIVILVTVWIFVIAAFVVVSFARVKKLENILEKEYIKALEKTKNTANVIETIKNARFKIGTIIYRLKNNEVYYYTVKVDNDTTVISSRDLFSVDETVIVCKVENTLFLIDIS